MKKKPVDSQNEVVLLYFEAPRCIQIQDLLDPMFGLFQNERQNPRFNITKPQFLVERSEDIPFGC